MANTLVRFLSGEEQNVDNEPISAGKVLFAVDPSAEGTYSGYIYYDFYDMPEKRSYVFTDLDPKTKYTVTVKACGFWNNISENSLDADIKTL